MNKKILKIISTIVAFGLCFPIHFLYDKFPNIITSIIAPVNESIWEHMKILFTSIIFTGILQKIYISKINKNNYNNICFSNFIGAILSIPIFLIMFLPTYNIIGENFIITIIIMLISIIISEYISYIIMNKEDLKLEKSTIFFVIITYTVFTLLTYFPPDKSIFVDSRTNTSGIQQKSS